MTLHYMAAAIAARGRAAGETAKAAGEPLPTRAELEARANTMHCPAGMMRVAMATLWAQGYADGYLGRETP